MLFCLHLSQYYYIYLKTINDNVKRIRSIKKLTQLQAAKKLGVSRVWYNKLENNEIDIKVDLLPRLAEIFNVPVTELTEINGSNYFSSNNTHSQIKNIGNVINDNENMKENYEKVIAAKNETIVSLHEQIDQLKQMVEKSKK